MKQSHRRLPLNGCERTFGQHVSHVFCCGTHLNGNRFVQNDSFKQPIQVNKMGARSVPQTEASSFHAHANDRLVVLYNVFLNKLSGMLDGTWSIISNDMFSAS